MAFSFIQSLWLLELRMKQLTDLYQLKLPKADIRLLSLVLDITKRSWQSRILKNKARLVEISKDDPALDYIGSIGSYKYGFSFEEKLLLQIQHKHSGKLAFVRLEYAPKETQQILYAYDGYLSELLELSFEQILQQARCTKIVFRSGSFEKQIRLNIPYTDLIDKDLIFDPIAKECDHAD